MELATVTSVDEAHINCGQCRTGKKRTFGYVVLRYRLYGGVKDSLIRGDVEPLTLTSEPLRGRHTAFFWNGWL